MVASAIFRFDRAGGAHYVSVAIPASEAGQLVGLLRERDGGQLAAELERALRVPAQPIVRLAAGERRLLLGALDELARSFGLTAELERLRASVSGQLALH